MLAAFALVEIKCPRCGKVNKIDIKEEKQRQEPIASTSE
ncbi:MAG: Com family DNA-binding transcriptional regulator [Lachnospiraceae bacterium]|nr:Com family DNA-binding transcriptional regulator [Lachnospiraceae bacterium]